MVSVMSTPDMTASISLPALDSASNTRAVATPVRDAHSISIENVSVSYPITRKARRTVLENISMSIEEGRVRRSPRRDRMRQEHPPAA